MASNITLTLARLNSLGTLCQAWVDYYNNCCNGALQFDAYALAEDLRSRGMQQIATWAIIRLCTNFERQNIIDSCGVPGEVDPGDVNSMDQYILGFYNLLLISEFTAEEANNYILDICEISYGIKDL